MILCALDPAAPAGFQGCYDLLDFSNLFAVAFTLNLGFSLISSVRASAKSYYSSLAAQIVEAPGDEHLTKNWALMSTATENNLHKRVKLFIIFTIIAAAISFAAIAAPMFYKSLYIDAYTIVILAAVTIVPFPWILTLIWRKWAGTYKTAIGTYRNP